MSNKRRSLSFLGLMCLAVSGTPFCTAQQPNTVVPPASSPSPLVEEHNAKRRPGQPLGLQPLQERSDIGVSSDQVYWIHLVKNTGDKVMTAFAGRFICPEGSSRHGESFVQDSLASFGALSSIPPGRTTAFLISNDDARCTGTVDTAIYADGSSIGNARFLREIELRRQGIGDELPLVVHQLEGVALHQISARELASRLLSQSDAMPIGQPLDMVAAGRRNVLTETANLLSRQALPHTPADFNPSGPPSVESTARSMHVTPEQAHAGLLMHKWAEWENALKLAGTRSDVMAVDTGIEAARSFPSESSSPAEPTLARHAGITPAPPTIPSSANCPLRVAAVRAREFGAGGPYQVHIRPNNPIRGADLILHGPGRDPTARQSTDTSLPEAERVAHIGKVEEKRTIVESDMWTGDVGGLRWFEITSVTFTNGRTWNSDGNSRCIYLPADPVNGSDWQSVLAHTKPTQYSGMQPGH